MHIRDSKFLISCAARTGSTMLVHLLRSNPAILCHGEVFEPRGVGHISGTYSGKRKTDPAFEQMLKEYRLRDPIRFLYDIVFDVQDRNVVGFKFKTDEAFRRDFRKFHKVIIADADIKVIHLRRRNVLDQYISHEVVMKQRGSTLLKGEAESPGVEPFMINIPDCLKYIKDVKDRDRRAARLYAGHRQIAIWYEDIVDAGSRSLAEVQEFLEVPVTPLSTPTRKILQNNASLVENYDDVVQAVLGRSLLTSSDLTG